MKTIAKLFAVFAVIGVLAGCARTAPIEQIDSTLSSNYTKAQVKKAILKAGLQRDWIMTEESNSVIKAKYKNRDHSVDVRIPYSAKGYSINYVDSYNLKAADGKIHRNYNRWVRNLDKDIQVNLSAAAAGL